MMAKLQITGEDLESGATCSPDQTQTEEGEQLGKLILYPIRHK